MAETKLPAARHETEDVSFPLLAAGLAGVLGVLFASMLFSLWLYPSARVDRRLPSALPTYPAPRLQSAPEAELRAFLAAEAQQLNTAGWVDRSRHVVHIPIDDAMRLLAERGIPDWPSGKAPEQ